LEDANPRPTLLAAGKPRKARVGHPGRTDGRPLHKRASAVTVVEARRRDPTCNGGMWGTRWKVRDDWFCDESVGRKEKMKKREEYAPRPAHSVEVKKDGDKWTLIVVRELRHPPEKVWRALTDPMHLREWAPFDVDRSLSAVGTVNLTWVGNPQVLEARVTQAEAARVLEIGDMRWELETLGSGTRLTLWHKIDRRFVTWGAAGWHISLEVLERQLAGEAIPRLAGGDAMQSEAWQRLVVEYAKQFGVEPAKWPGQRGES
jgi:uncharacterized protein YndB with AHSA1/START domain